MIQYEYGYIYVDGDLCRLERDGTITVGGYGMIHDSLRKEVLKEYLHNFWTKKLKGDHYLLIVRDDAWIVKDGNIKEATFKRLSKLMDPDEYGDELPMI